MSKELLRLVLALILILIAYATRNERTSKKKFAEEYGVSKHVLGKWMEHFQNQISLEEWKNAKYLSTIDVAFLRTIFGEGRERTMNKAQMAREMGTNYRDLCKQVSRHASAYGLTEQAWRNCHCFPPIVTEAIIKNA